MKSFVILAAAFSSMALASTTPVANNPLAAIIAADTAIADYAIAELCNHDNALRCLLGDPLIANPFCIDYISIPMKTTTVSTVTPTVIVTKGGKRNAMPTSVDMRDMKSRRKDGLAKVKREPAITARTLFPTKPPAPVCIIQVSSTSYPASRISSACSCLSPPSILPFTLTLPAVTITIQAPKAKRTQVPVAVGPNNIPTGEFQIQASSGVQNVNNAVLGGVISDDYYTGFNLPYGQYDLTFTVDLTTGYVSAEAPGKVGVVYLVAYTGEVDSGNSIPYIITESSPTGAGWVPLECRITKDAHGKYPLICRAGEYTVPTLINVNGDSHRELGIAKPGDKSSAGDLTMYAVFV